MVLLHHCLGLLKLIINIRIRLNNKNDNLQINLIFVGAFHPSAFVAVGATGG